MRKITRKMTLILLCVLVLTAPLGAKAALIGSNRVYQPPALTIILLGASSQAEMKVSMMQRNGEQFNTLPGKENRLWESVFRITRGEVMGKSAWFGNAYDFQHATIHIEDKGQTFSIPVPYEQLKEKDLDDYLILNLKTGEMRVGIPAARTWGLFFFHIALYLLVEGVILWLMGVRSRRSWIIFIIYTVLSKGIVCFLARHWLNVDPKLYLVFAAGALFYIMMDMAFYIMFMDSEPRNTMGKFAGISNFAAALAMFGAMTALPM